MVSFWWSFELGLIAYLPGTIKVGAVRVVKEPLWTLPYNKLNVKGNLTLTLASGLGDGWRYTYVWAKSPNVGEMTHITKRLVAKCLAEFPFGYGSSLLQAGVSYAVVHVLPVVVVGGVGLLAVIAFGF